MIIYRDYFPFSITPESLIIGASNVVSCAMNGGISWGC